MTQAKEGHTGAADVVSDYDAICRVLQLCTDGEAKGDVAKLQEAFHADARMFGSLAGTRYDVPIAELFALAESARRHRHLPLARPLGAPDGGCGGRRGGRGGLLGDGLLHRLLPARAYRGGLEDRVQAVRPHRRGAARGDLS